MLFAALALGQSPDLPPVPREFRAAWVATVDNIDWPSKPGLPAARQRAELVRLLDRAVTLKLNAIVFQVRPGADALYRSKLEPWSSVLTGRQGRDPGYDPLAFAVEQAHRRGLELHAWFNPYRARPASMKGPLALNHIAHVYPRVVHPYGKGQLWMDPGEPLVQRRSRDVILDVVRRYDVDGVHIDDYFYPYPEGKAPFPDAAAYSRYGGGLSLGDWRRKNVDDFVHGVYDEVHRAKPWVQFGISPFGVWRPGVPAGTTAGIDQYATLYADPNKWLQNGWCDYIAPQLYWAISQKPQSFPVLLDWWRSINPLGRHVYAGLYTSRLLPGESLGKYSADEIVRQIRLTRQGGDAGHVHFSMKALMQDAHGVADRLRGELYADDALPPPSPWLDAVPPKPPKNVDRITQGFVGWAWSDADPADPAFHYVVWLKDHQGHIRTIVQPGRINGIGENSSEDAIAVVAVDRSGNASEPTRLTPPEG